MGIKAVVFDCDGILADTESYQWLGWVEVLKPLGLTIRKDDYTDNYAGKDGKIIEKMIFSRLNLKDIGKGKLLEKKERLLLGWFRTKQLRQMPYADETVRFFIDRRMPVAVASGSPRDETELKLRKTGLYDFFSRERIVSGRDVLKGKPHPDIYMLASERLGKKPWECLAFEDTQYGVESAKAAGFACYAVPTEWSANQDFSKADAVFSSLREAVNYIEKKGLIKQGT